MTKTRRKKLSALSEQLEEINDSIREILSEEEDARDNTPESLQDTEAYTEREDACDGMEEVIGYLDDAIAAIDEIVGG